MTVTDMTQQCMHAAWHILDCSHLAHKHGIKATQQHLTAGSTQLQLAGLSEGVELHVSDVAQLQCKITGARQAYVACNVTASCATKLTALLSAAVLTWAPLKHSCAAELLLLP